MDQYLLKCKNKIRLILILVALLFLGGGLAYVGPRLIMTTRLNGPSAIIYPGDVQTYHAHRLEQAEESFVFAGRVVYGSGEPVPQSEVTLSLHSIQGPNGKVDRLGIYEVERITDAEGYFKVEDTGQILIIRSVDDPAKLLYETSILSEGMRIPNTLGFSLSRNSASEYYVPDQNNPAIVVLVRPNEVINTWPCRGGKDVYPNGQEYINTPMRPRKPSVPLIETEEGWVYSPEY